MGNDGVNTTRRRFLTAATTVVGVAGAAGIAVPFVGSWVPSAKAKAIGAPVKFDISKLEPGEMKVVEWRGQPIYVVRRTQATIDTLATLEGSLKDPASGAVEQQPAYITGTARALNPEFMVLIGLCTHLGCAPKFRPDVGSVETADGSEWVGGFFCPCHGSMFDLSGRVYKGVPASLNLKVPPYSFESDNVLVIGVDQETV